VAVALRRLRLADGRLVEQPRANCHGLGFTICLLDDRNLHDRSTQLKKIYEKAGLVLGGGRLVEQPGANRHGLDLAVRLLDDRNFHDASLQLAKGVDDDVYEPGTQGAGFLLVVGLLAFHHFSYWLRVTGYWGL